MYHHSAKQLGGSECAIKIIYGCRVFCEARTTRCVVWILLTRFATVGVGENVKYTHWSNVEEPVEFYTVYTPDGK